jgi:P27 family predicted phage terminase small subunit
MRKSQSKSAPRHLSAEARAWWKRIVENFEIDDDSGLLILRTAMESLDRLREAQTLLKADGICIADRFGQKRQHPATMIERDARTAMMRALKALNLDVDPIGEIGRPAGR